MVNKVSYRSLMVINGRLCPAMGTVGQLLFLVFGVTGFGRDKDKKPDIQLEMDIVDDKGKSTLDKPYSQKLDNSDPALATVSVVPLNFPFALTRTGKYTVKLKATDVSDPKKPKVAEATYTFTVVEAPK